VISPLGYALVNMTSSHMTTVSLPSGFVKARAQPLVNGTPESPIPDFPKRVISRHVATRNRSVYDCFGVSTMEHPDLSSPELPSSRFPISRNGKSHDTWPPLIGRPESTSGFLPWNAPIFRHQNSRVLDSRFPEVENLLTRGLRYSDGPDLFRGFRPYSLGVYPSDIS
jgi:hypothetical protein